MKPKIYLETTIVSYLTARPSRDLVLAAHQQVTREWWDRRERFDLFISELVVREAGRGNAEAANRRLETMKELPVLSLSEEAIDLAERLVGRGPLPPKALADALHIGIAITSGLDFLLTWNCSHIANASMQKKIARICVDAGYDPAVICTPEELMEDEP